MSWLENFTVRKRLQAAFALLLLLMTAIVTNGIRGGWEVESQTNALTTQEMRKFELAASINSATRANARNTLQLFVANAGDRSAIRARMSKTKADIDGYLEELDKLIYLPRGRELFDEIKAKRKLYVAAFTDAAEVLETGNADVAKGILTSRVLPAIDALAIPIEVLLSLQQDIAQKRALDVQSLLQAQTSWSLGLGTFALVVGVFAAWSLLVSIMRPLGIAKEATRKMAGGDLTVSIEVNGHNELADTLIALDQMRQSLAHVMYRIQESAGQVALASGEIAAANMDLSSRTEEQASALEQTAATMEEITSTVQNNSQTTSHTRQMAEQASAAARGVGVLVSSVVETMQDLHTSSQRIRDIVSVIDSIAFQTNILALNASIEAARAGEHGRGFAVVASEVRMLAQRSASAAKEIKDIVEVNVGKMDVGNIQAMKAGEAVSEAVRNIEQVSSTIQEVDTASQEQSLGIGQIGQAVGQMDTVTQQNAALVEQTAAATQNLDEQVKGLKEQISRFRISGSPALVLQ